MVTFVAFLGGALAAAAALGLGLYSYVKKLKTLEKKVKLKEDTLRRGVKRLRDEEQKVNQAQDALNNRRERFESSIVSYDVLQKENIELKQDLFNLSVAQKKSDEDFRTGEKNRIIVEKYTNEISGRYLDDNSQWLVAKITPKNYAQSKKRLIKVINRVRSIGYDVGSDKESTMINDLKIKFEKKVKEEYQREEQARIRDQLREEKKLEQEIERQLKDSERETKAIEAALNTALQQAQ